VPVVRQYASLVASYKLFFPASVAAALSGGLGLRSRVRRRRKFTRQRTKFVSTNELAWLFFFFESSKLHLLQPAGCPGKETKTLAVGSVVTNSRTHEGQRQKNGVRSNRLQISINQTARSFDL
jgi:hypothetical protein